MGVLIRERVPSFPSCPEGALMSPDQTWVRPLFGPARGTTGGIVATQAQFGNFTERPAGAVPCDPQTLARGGSTAKESLSIVTALSLEFVATPQAVRAVSSAIPLAIHEALRDVTGFAGCLTMISDQESRLITVVTFWTGEDRARQCSRTARWVRKLVSPYLDHCLRVQTFDAFLPAVSSLAEAFSGTNSAGLRSGQEDPLGFA